MLSVGERPRPYDAQRHPPTPARWDDRSRAITTVAPLSSPHNSTSHRVLRSTLDAGPTPRRGRSPPPPALVASASTLRDSLVGSQGPFFEFFNDGGRAHVQYPRGITNAARIQRHIDDLLLDLRRLPEVGIFQKKRPP